MWPAAWLMGNLARATFEKSTMARICYLFHYYICLLTRWYNYCWQSVWPWSYDQCDGSINELEAKQQISACHAAPGYGMHPHQGRGAPEIGLIYDIIVEMTHSPDPILLFYSFRYLWSHAWSQYAFRRPCGGLHEFLLTDITWSRENKSAKTEEWTQTQLIPTLVPFISSTQMILIC